MTPVAHARQLWGPYWVLPALFFGSYAAVMFVIGDLRPEHVAIPLLACTLAYATPKTKRFFIDVSPYLAVAIGYDSVRYARQWLLTPEQVWGCGLRELELSAFAVAPGVTLQDYLATHNSPALDLLFAVPYAIFVYVAIAYAAYLFFVDRPRMRHYLWAFAIANFTSFAMWLLIPAAPPWYIREFGCAIDLSAAPSPAALARVDTLLGIDYFARFYSRAASVFGAMPSMHCAYPVIGLLTAWRAASWKTRPIHVGYSALMVVAAVYLDHHWVWDALAGIAVAGFATWAAKRALAYVERTPERPSLAPEPAE